MFKKPATNFCQNTYIHGFKFIVLPKRRSFEVFFWVTITAISLSTALTLAWMYWAETKTSPIWTLSDSPNYAIWNYPFPAITICNFNVISRTRAHEVAQKLKRPPKLSIEDLAWYLRFLYYLIDPTDAEVPYHSLSLVQEVLDDNEIEIENLMQYLAPSCKEMLQRCTWKGQQYPCDNLFEQTKTSNGFCCSYNYFGLKNHTFSSTKYISLKAAKQPRRVAATGYLTAFEAVINSVPEDYFVTPLASYGHRVFVHYPYTLPGENGQSIVQATQGLIFISVKPTLYLPDGRLNTLSISQRKCLFRQEKELLNLQYTYYNCISECRANITRELCGCIPFYYYHNNYKADIPRTCNLRDVICLAQYEKQIRSSIPSQTENLTPSSDWEAQYTKCGCFPDCEYCYYILEGSNGVLIKEYAVTKQTLYGKLNLVNQSVFRIFFDDLVAKKYTTFVRYYWHTLLGFLGGLLGLIIGFSIVSIIEAVHFFTFQPLINFIVKKRQKLSIQKKTKELFQESEKHIKIQNYLP